MSNKPRRRPRGHANRQQLEAAAMIGARLRGCTCKPDFKLRHTPNETVMRVEHDSWCPAHDTGRQWLITW